MCVDNDAVGDDEAARQHPRVARGRSDDVAFERCCRSGAQNGRGVGDLPPAAAREAVGAVRSQLGVGEGLERGRPGLEECLHLFVRALPDDGDADTSLDEFLVTIAQLREVPAAERSAVMSKEDERDRLLGPQAR